MEEYNVRIGPVLLVEDNGDYALLVRLAFKDARVGNPLHVVADGESAIEYFTRWARGEPMSTPLPALVLLDLSLPGKSGFEVLTWLRSQPRFASLPVVVLSSSSDPGDLERVRNLGAEDYVVKPTRFADLVTIVGTLARTWLLGEGPASADAVDQA